MNFDRYRNALNRLESLYSRRYGQAETLQKQREESLARLRETSAEIELLEKVRLLLQETSSLAREKARRQIEHTVTHALQFVFGPGISFRIELVERRNQPEAEFYVVSQYGEVEVKTRPQDARGGGVVDVVSLALRVSLLETLRPPMLGPLLLDEPGKHLSDEFAPHLALLIKEMSGTFSRQVLMVTHNRHFTEAADQVYLVEIKEGRSILSEVATDLC